MDKITVTAMRRYNRKQIFNLIYQEKRISRLQIAEKELASFVPASHKPLGIMNICFRYCQLSHSGKSDLQLFILSDISLFISIIY